MIKISEIGLEESRPILQLSAAVTTPVDFQVHTLKDGTAKRFVSEESEKQTRLVTYMVKIGLDPGEPNTQITIDRCVMSAINIAIMRLTQ